MLCFYAFHSPFKIMAGNMINRNIQKSVLLCGFVGEAKGSGVLISLESEANTERLPDPKIEGERLRTG